jgi:anti-sigma regulatory factor (Ser/Thr protein kinase)
VTEPLRLDVRRRRREEGRGGGGGGDRGEGGLELSLDVPSDLAYVGPAVELLADELPRGILSPRRVRFNFRTALAEALANAIAYGNRHDRTRVVRVEVELDRDAVRVHVTDEGAGFDPTRVPDPTRPERLERENGRGLFVLARLVDDVAFNAKGNSVCLTLRAG